MDSETWFEAAVVVVALLLAAFAAAAETAVRSISKTRIQHQLELRGSRSQALKELLESPVVLGSTVIIINTLAMITAASFTTILAMRLAPGNYLNLAAIVVTFVIVLVFCQAVPRSLAMHNPEVTSLWVAGPMQVLATIMRPIVILLSGATCSIERFLGLKPTHGPLVTEEELRILVGAREGEGLIEEDEKEMIRGVFELEETTAREIMVPRIDIFAVEAEMTLAELLPHIIDNGYSRVPVYEETIDNIIGVVYVKDIFKYVQESNLSIKVKEIVRPAYFIPDSKKIDELLRELQQRKVHMAIVVDEYGGTAGLVTIEDLLEEIVGEIQDEYDREEVKIQQISEEEAIFDAAITVHDVNEILSLQLDEEEVDTIGGLVYNRLGKIPLPGDEVKVDDVTVSVISTDGRRIRKVRVKRSAAEQPLDAADA
ncbi:MAG: hemolysin family protein [Chloroflexi bacterium]|nr:hemolysin family protein [Chloroflexota bacterium]MCL5074921.1 hemolysin family protein [Chloroflexota bacterium]